MIAKLFKKQLHNKYTKKCVLLTQLLERMARMCSTPQRTLMTNATLASPTIDTQFFVMRGTLIVFIGFGECIGLYVTANLL